MTSARSSKPPGEGAGSAGSGPEGLGRRVASAKIPVRRHGVAHATAVKKGKEGVAATAGQPTEMLPVDTSPDSGKISPLIWTNMRTMCSVLSVPGKVMEASPSPRSGHVDLAKACLVGQELSKCRPTPPGRRSQVAPSSVGDVRRAARAGLEPGVYTFHLVYHVHPKCRLSGAGRADSKWNMEKDARPARERSCAKGRCAVALKVLRCSPLVSWPWVSRFQRTGFKPAATRVAELSESHPCRKDDQWTRS